jgi:hypothetical protein
MFGSGISKNVAVLSLVWFKSVTQTQNTMISE